MLADHHRAHYRLEIGIVDVVRGRADVRAVRDHRLGADRHRAGIIKPHAGTDQAVAAELEVGREPHLDAGMNSRAGRDLGPEGE